MYTIHNPQRGEQNNSDELFTKLQLNDSLGIATAEIRTASVVSREIEPGITRYTWELGVELDGPDVYSMVNTWLHPDNQTGPVIHPYDQGSAKPNPNSTRVYEATIADWLNPQFIKDHIKFIGKENWNLITHHTEKWARLMSQFREFGFYGDDVEKRKSYKQLEVMVNTINGIITGEIFEEYYDYYSRNPKTQRTPFQNLNIRHLFMSYFIAKANEINIPPDENEPLGDFKSFSEGDLRYIFGIDNSGTRALIINRDKAIHKQPQNLSMDVEKRGRIVKEIQEIRPAQEVAFALMRRDYIVERTGDRLAALEVLAVEG